MKVIAAIGIYLASALSVQACDCAALNASLDGTETAREQFEKVRTASIGHYGIFVRGRLIEAMSSEATMVGGSGLDVANRPAKGVRYTLAIEKVIKGTLPGRVIEFYEVMDGSDCDMHGSALRYVADTRNVELSLSRANVDGQERYFGGNSCQYLEWASDEVNWRAIEQREEMMERMKKEIEGKRQSQSKAGGQN